MLALSLLIYGALCAELVVDPLFHQGWVLLGVRYVLLLPAVIVFLRSHPESFSSERRLFVPPAGVLIAGCLIVALFVSWHSRDGITISDESAYRFQARIFSVGHLWAVPLPGAAGSSVLPAAVTFDHHIVRPGRWFTKYPPGWPLLLALPERLHLGWLVNPLLGALLLWFIFLIGEDLFGRDTAKLALLFAVLSPYFLVYSTGYMAHASCAVLTAGALCALLRALRRSAVLWVVISFSLLAYASLIRPLTGFVSIFLILAFGIRCSGDQPRLRRYIICIGITGVAIAMGLTLAYNEIYTGAYWLSPYALTRGLNTPKEISLDPRLILRNLAFLARWSLQNTLVYTVPFVFLLSVYAVFREWRTAPKVRLLAAFFPTLLVAYLVQTETSASFIGERYYFEAFFAILLLAARGFMLLGERWNSSKFAVTGLVVGFTLLQAEHLTLAGLLIKQRSGFYSQAAALAQHLPDRPYVVFFAGQNDDSSKFIPRHFNRNLADWDKARQVFLVDPGVDQRAMWACRLHRREWAVIGPDQKQKEVSLELGTLKTSCP